MTQDVGEALVWLCRLAGVFSLIKQAPPEIASPPARLFPVVGRNLVKHCSVMLCPTPLGCVWRHPRCHAGQGRKGENTVCQLYSLAHQEKIVAKAALGLGRLACSHHARGRPRTMPTPCLPQARSR